MSPLAAQTVVVGYTEEDLTDTTAGQDLWRYTYVITGAVLGVGQGFSIFFDDALFTAIQSPPPVVNDDWDVIAVQPDTGLGSDGFYDAIALVPSPSFVGTFVVDFIWLGAGAPAAQRFTTYDTDFSTIEEGMTTHKNGRIVNFSIRSPAGTDDRTLVVGVVVSGNDKTILMRGIGPTLLGFGVEDALADSRLELFSGGSSIAVNDDWGAAANFDELKATSNLLGAFAIADDSKDAAFLITLDNGPYSAHCTGVGGTTGVALVEMYDTDPESGARLVNVSARTQVETGNGILIAGFVIVGDGPRTLLIRGVGLELANHGIESSILLQDPELTIYEKIGEDSVPIESNDDWGSAANASVVAQVAATLGAFPLTGGSTDAALLVTLPPGIYTANVRGKDMTTGVALVEVYDAP